jgi:excisionase family DNA binding protein
MSETLSAREAAQRLGVTPRTIIKWINRGTFPNAYKLNPDGLRSAYRIPLTDIEALESRRGNKEHQNAI